MANRTPIHVDLTVVFNFGEEHGSVTIIDDLRMPFTDLVIQVRDRGAELMISGLSKAVYATPSMWASLFGSKRG